MSVTAPKRSRGWGSPFAALVALGLNVLLLGLLTIIVAIGEVPSPSISTWLWDVSHFLAKISTLAFAIGALGFLPWLRKSYERALVLSPTSELQQEWDKGPVVGFFIPLLNLVRPYYAVSVLNRAVDPDRVPPPPLRLDEDTAHYRAPPTAAPERRAAPPALVGLWWSLWLARSVGGAILRLPTLPDPAIAFIDLVNCSAAIAACFVVARIEARLVELERRQAALRES